MPSRTIISGTTSQWAPVLVKTKSGRPNRSWPVAGHTRLFPTNRNRAGLKPPAIVCKKHRFASRGTRPVALWEGPLQQMSEFHVTPEVGGSPRDCSLPFYRYMAMEKGKVSPEQELILSSGFPS
jgi:hypothetical protein